MRLVYLDPHPVPDRVPEAMQILQTVDALGSLGVEVALATPEPPSGVTIELILGRPLARQVRPARIMKASDRLMGLGRSNQPFYRRAVRWIRDQDFDAVLIRNLKLAEHLLRAAAHPRLFFEMHEVFAQTYREDHPAPGWRERAKLAALEAREGFVYREAVGLIALTPMLLDDARAAYSTTIPGIAAPDGVDLAAAQAARLPRPPNRRPVILYLGSLHPWKGVDVLVRAMADVPQAELRIAGGSRRRMESLARLASASAVSDRVRFLGEIEPARRFELINEADVCALPLADTSIGARYTSPLKLFEYMAMGKAIVASDLASIRTVLADEHDALLVAPGDARALGAALRRLAEDRPLRDKLGAAVSALAQHYSWAARATRIRNFIQHTLGHVSA